MPVRQLSSTEATTAKSLRTLGLITRWEWMAALDVDLKTVITFRTDSLSDRTDVDTAVHQHWTNNGRIIIHHNHPSNESLSLADWNVLLKDPIDEIFAHAADGSVFYGKLLNCGQTAASLVNYDAAADAGEAVIINAGKGHPQALGPAAGFLRKHIICCALLAKGYVDYQFDLGPVWTNILAAYSADMTNAVNSATLLL